MEHFADIELARRIEDLGAWSQRAWVSAYESRFPEYGSTLIEIAGGVAAFLEPGSPVNGAVGVGLRGVVTPDDFALIEEFFRGRGERPLIGLTPMVDPSLMSLLGRGGWTPSAFENVLVRDLAPAEVFEPAPPGIEVRVASTSDELELWAALVANGFSAPEDPSPADLRLGRAAVAAPDGRFLIAFAGGEPAGTGELHVVDGIGWLTGDTTLPQFRCRGVQAAVQRARLQLARDAGCALAMTEATPGSASQRNMERLGFRIAYTRVEVLAPEHPVERTI